MRIKCSSALWRPTEDAAASPFVLEESGPLPDVRPADRKRWRDMRFMLKSDGRLHGPLNISVAAECTIKSEGEKVLNEI